MTADGSRKLRTLVTAPLLDEREAVRRIYGHVRGRRPLPPSRVSGGRRLTYGFLLPFQLFARLVTVPELRRAAGRLFLARALFVVLFTVVGMLAVGFTEDRPAAESSDIVVENGGIHIRGSEKDLKKAVKALREENAREAAEGDRVEAAIGAVVADVVEREGAAAPVIAPAVSWKKRLATLLAFLGAAEWIAIAFTRDFDDVVSHELSVDAGILPEGERPSPRLRFSPSWLWKKYKRKFRGILLFGIGALPLALAIAFGRFGWLSNALFALWGFYWSAVFVAAKNAHAWADDGRPTVVPPPLRADAETIRVRAGARVPPPCPSGHEIGPWPLPSLRAQPPPVRRTGALSAAPRATVLLSNFSPDHAGRCGTNPRR